MSSDEAPAPATAPAPTPVASIAIEDNVEFIAAIRIKHKCADQLEDVDHKLTSIEEAKKHQLEELDKYFASLTTALEARKTHLAAEIEKHTRAIKGKLEEAQTSLSANLEVCTQLLDVASQLYPSSQEAAVEGLQPIKTLPSVTVLDPVFKVSFGKGRRRAHSHAHSHHPHSHAHGHTHGYTHTRANVHGNENEQESSNAQGNSNAQKKHSPVSQRHSPVSQHHSPGSQHHSPGSQHYSTVSHQQQQAQPHQSPVGDELSSSLLDDISREGEVIATVLKYQVGQLTLLAGAGQEGHQDGKREQASFISPLFVAFNPLDGHAYLSDSSNHRIRKISPQGVVTTLAGKGVAGYEDGPASEAKFNYPRGLTVNQKTGDIYVCDYTNNRIRKISPSGVVSTVAGSGKEGCTDGESTVASFANPTCIAFSQLDGSLFVSDHFNHRIRHISPSGQVATVAGSNDGYSDGDAHEAKFSYPFGIAIHPVNGDLYVADYGNDRIRKISAGLVTTVVGIEASDIGKGQGGQVDSFHAPYSLHFYKADMSLMVAEYSANRIRKISQEGTVATMAWLNEDGQVSTYVPQPASMDIDQDHKFCYIASNSHRVYLLSFP